MSKTSSITVLIPREGESWTMFLQRMKSAPGELLIILSGRDDELQERADLRGAVLTACSALRERLRVATKQPKLVAEARQKGIRVLDRTKYVKLLLQDHEQLAEALRVFSPHLWRQQLTVRLQRIGLLSMPRMRISLLVGTSVVLFLFVVFRLLPSADIRVVPRQESVVQTMNIVLVQSGAVVEGVRQVRTMPLIPLTVQLRRSLTSNSISKEFIGTSSEVAITILNKSPQSYSLRKGTRLTNQAGMIFRLREPVVNLAPGQEVPVRAKADDKDLYEQIIGDRGNVLAGLKWQIPGLAQEERMLVYGENRKPGAGGTTAYRAVLRKEDLDLALRRLEQQLLATAKELVEEERTKYNASDSKRTLAILSYPELTKIVFSGTVLPLGQIGKAIPSFSVEQTLIYTALAYDAQGLLAFLRKELMEHVQEGKQLMPDSLTYEHLDVRVIGYDDNLGWVKLTAELVGSDRFILDPLTPAGALFGKRLREKIAGTPAEEALRIVRNLPEVEEASISLWPPWQRRLPSLPSNISITTD